MIKVNLRKHQVLLELEVDGVVVDEVEGVGEEGVVDAVEVDLLWLESLEKNRNLPIWMMKIR
jgi:hypothetical protein